MNIETKDNIAVCMFFILFVVLFSSAVYLIEDFKQSKNTPENIQETTANNTKQSVFIDSHKKNPVDRFNIELEQLEQSIKYNETVKILAELRPKLLAKATKLEQTKLDYQLNLAKTKEQILLTNKSLEVIDYYINNNKEIDKNTLSSLLNQFRIIEESLED